MLVLDREKHFPGHAAIAEVSSGAGAQFGDVLGFREIHFEETADAGCEWEQIKSRLGAFRCLAGRDLCARLVGSFDGGLVISKDASFGKNIGIACEMALVGRLTAIQ